MRAGELTELVVLQAFTDARNGAGEVVRTYVDGDEVWARIRQPAAAEHVRNGVTNVVAPFAVRIRWRDDVRESHRLKWGTRTLEISSAVPDPRREYLDIVATEVRS